MKKRKYILIIFITVVFLGYILSFEQPIEKTSIVMTIPQYHNGDAKFYKDVIITSHESMLTMIDFNGDCIKQFSTINSNWIDSISEEGIIVYANFNNEVGVIKLDDTNNIISNQIIMRTEHLQIDPTITKIEDDYYITVTEIIGTINNSDLEVENGRYIVHLYRSKDLVNWTFISDIADEKSNLEDVEILYEDGYVYAMYEEEVLDKGNSMICVKKSVDKGISWESPQILLEADCDHEPVSIIVNSNGYTLYYSCDKAALGQSYMGARAYYAQFDKNFGLIEKDIEVQTETETGILWYDITEIKGDRYVLFAKDYLTDCDMILECE